MRKLMTGVSALYLTGLAVIMLVLLANPLLLHLKRGSQPNEQLLQVMVSEHMVYTRSTAVFEAIVDNSYEVFIRNNSTGLTRQLTTHFANDRFPVLSPTGDQVAFVSWRDGNSEIYTIELATGRLHNLSNHPAPDLLPVWSPDGTLLAYVSRRDNNYDIYLIDVARGLTRNLTRSPYHDTQPEWLPGGQRLVFSSNREGKRTQYRLDLSGRNLIRYRPESGWQTAQNIGTLDSIQRTIPG